MMAVDSIEMLQELTCHGLRAGPVNKWGFVAEYRSMNRRNQTAFDPARLFGFNMRGLARFEPTRGCFVASDAGRSALGDATNAPSTEG